MAERQAPTRWCVVTGASRGIGRAVAQGLLAGGFGVVGIARRAALLAEPGPGPERDPERDPERERPRRFIPLAHDVTRPGLLAALAELAAQGRLRLEEIELAVHCAGCAFQGRPLTQMDDEALQAMIATNVLGTTLVVRDLAGLLQRRGSGTLVVLGSVAGDDAAPLMAVYAASKAYTRHLVRCVRADLHGSGVRVSCVQPGTTRTGLLDGQPGLAAGERFDGFSPLETADIARAIAWIHDQPAHVNVQEIDLFPLAQSLYVRGIHRQPPPTASPPCHTPPPSPRSLPSACPCRHPPPTPQASTAR